MMTVIQTQSRFSGLTLGWLAFVELAMARWRTQRATRRIRARGAIDDGVTPEAREEAELRAAYRLWFGKDPLGRL